MSERSPITIKIAQTLINILPKNNVLNSFATMYINKYHNYSNIDMHTNGEYRWLKQVIESETNPVVFDVGANMGKWTKIILSLNSSAVVHAFEPTPTIFEQLSQQQFPPQVHLNHLGLGDKKTILPFYEYDAHTHNSFHQSHIQPYQRVVDVQIDTLNNYCSQMGIDNIRYLKIDTEGNDYFVLLGAKSLLEQEKIDVIQFEYGSKYIDARVFLKDVFTFIEPLNYSIYKIMQKNLLHLPQYANQYEKFVYSNYTIVHNRIAETLGLAHR